jgi:nucleotide-binding universal stress UspA family protein
MRILLAYDGSPSADAAVEEVASRPWPPGSQLRLVTVVDALGVLAAGEMGGIYLPVIERIRASLRARAYDRVREVSRGIEARTSLATSCEVREGSVTPALLDAIREWHADLAVVGSSGATGAAKPFLGSVSQGLATAAPCSVEIVPLRVAAP